MFTDPFYHLTFRKYVIAFGSLFDDVTIVRTATDDTEVQRVKVPMSYGPKERFVARFLQDPNLEHPTQVTLPRMGFEIMGITYDSSRKLNTMHARKKAQHGVKGVALKQYIEVPYNIQFALNVYTKNIEDGTQIIEQILPYFTPDYTITLHLIPEMSITADIPIVIENVTPQDTYEGDFSSSRLITWTLTFVMKARFYGPVKQKKVITQAQIDTYIVPTGTEMRPADKLLTEQGESYVFEDNSGRVLLESDELGFSTAARVSRVTAVPNPINAQVGDEFTATTTIETFEDGKQFNPRTLTDEDIDTATDE